MFDLEAENKALLLNYLLNALSDKNLYDAMIFALEDEYNVELPISGKPTIDSLKTAIDYSHWESFDNDEWDNLFGRFEALIMQNNAHPLQEDVYYPKETPEEKAERRLKEQKIELDGLVASWIDDNIGAESAHGYIDNKGNIIVAASPIKNNKGETIVRESQPKIWEETALELINFLDSNEYSGYEVGSYSSTRCFISKIE